MRNKLLLIDGNNVLISSWHALKDLETSEGQQIGGLYGFYVRLKRLIKMHPDYTAVVAWDGGRAPWRLALHPEYKGNRKKLEPEDFEALQWQLKQSIRLCKALGIITLKLKDVEADDIIATLARGAGSAVIYSTDKDFFQLAVAGIKVRRPVRRKQEFAEGEDPDQIVRMGNYKACTEETFKVPYERPGEVRFAYGLVGDNSDNIAGIKGIGHKKAWEIFQAVKDEYGAAVFSIGEMTPGKGPGDDVGHLIRSVCSGHRLKSWKRVDEEWDSFLTAWKLTDLWRPELLTGMQIRKLVLRIERTRSMFKLDEVVECFREWEFTEEEDDWMSYLQHVMANRRKSIHVKDLDFRYSADWLVQQ